MIDTIFTFHDNAGVRFILLLLAVLYLTLSLAPSMRKYEEKTILVSFKNAVLIVAVIDVAIIAMKYYS